MEMKDHINYIKKYRILIALFGIAIAIGAYVISSQRPPSYKAVLGYEIELINRGETQDYQFGSYYDLKGSEIFTQHLMSILHSPAVIQEIYDAAGLGYEIKNLSQFTNQFRTDQGSAQNFTVTFSRYTEEEAVELSNGMTTVLTERVVESQVDEAGKGLFRLRPTDPVIVYEELNPWLAAVVALISGWIFIVIVLYLKRYLKTPTKS